MAKRRRRRPKAGPPPVRNPRREAAPASGTDGKPKAKAPARGGGRGGAGGAPVMPTFKGVVVRAAIAAVVFYVYLLVVGSKGTAALLITLVAFIIMIPLGMLMARLVYRIQLKRWEKRRAGG